MLLVMKTVIKILFGFVGLVVVGLGFLIGYAALTDYRPPPRIKLYENRSAPEISAAGDIHLMIWNIGYAGLSKDMDFFYDGGSRVRPEKKIVIDNLAVIEKEISNKPRIDFFLLQEVDRASKRSYQINEVGKIADLIPGFYSYFGKNYDVFHVPVPFTNPLGKVKSGLQALSRFEPVSVERFSFPGNYKWPKGLFMLDRCFLVMRFKLDNGHELLIINTHNSAYDDGSLREEQMAYLERFLKAEYAKGSFVIVGGDWNQCPPGFVPRFDGNKMDNRNRKDIDKGFMTGWQWAFDPKIPSNRRLAAPYDKTATPTTVIDFFLVSPNIAVKKTAGLNLGFAHSDHQPVLLTARLQP